MLNRIFYWKHGYMFYETRKMVRKDYAEKENGSCAATTVEGLNLHWSSLMCYGQPPP